MPAYDYILLMTACIEPQNLQRSGFRINPQQRFSDYKTAFNYWLNYNSEKITGIIFCENSGYPLKDFVKLADTENKYNRNIEFLQFKATERKPGVHYGYSEMELIDYVFDNSKILNEYSIIVKTTGRLYFPKLHKLVKYFEVNEKDFIADSRDYKFGKREKHYLISTLFIVNALFYKKYLYNIKATLGNHDAWLMENLYFNELNRIASDKILLRFPFNVDPVGFGAHNNINYNSFRNKIESFIRSITRICIPSLKI